MFHLKGTGITRTLVAAIEEIVRTSNKCVLVCANSNAACDELTKRLLKVFHNGEIYRIYAKSYDKKHIEAEFRTICNLQNGEIKFPSCEFLYQFRVVICTLLTYGTLARAHGADPNFSSKHFGYIFIDEAACIHETTAIIPIASVYLTKFIIFIQTN